MSPENVSAVIVTRGNVDLGPILSSLIFDDVVVWDNSTETDLGTYAIVPACERAKHDVIFSQDDDIVHTPENQARIVAAYKPGVLTGCMWDEWSDGAAQQGIPGGYDGLVFYGSGAVYDRRVPFHAANWYLDHHPDDAFFRLWASCAIGVLAATRQLDIRFDALPHAEAPDRMCNLPNAVEAKAEMIRRAREIRGWKRGMHRAHLDEVRQGIRREHRYGQFA